MQSGGLNDSTQRSSFANLFALQAGTRFSYPSFPRAIPVVIAGKPVQSGCPAPLGNWVSQKLVDSLAPTPSGCDLRDASKVTDVLNNVGVPGAYASDLLVTGPAVKVPLNGLNTLILGGKSQVDRALDADPTFISLWIGNNETLGPASVGLMGGLASAGVPPLVTPAEFTAAYNAAVDSLVRARPNLKGILIGAVRVTNTARFFSADTLGQNATRRGQFQTFHGKGTTAIIGCGTTVTGWLVSAELAKAIKAGTHPNVVSCVTNQPQAPVGDIFMLDPTEQATLNATTDAYNVTVKAKADALGWAYLDPNPALAALKTGTAPLVPGFPNFTSNTRDAATAPFGALFSLDGVHPSAAGQRLIANLVIDQVNTTYGLAIPHVP
jgi:lysophospholipase L1-like esterase